MVQPRRQNVSAGGVGMGNLSGGGHHSAMNLQQPQTSHGTRGGQAFDKLKKKMVSRP